MSPEPQKRIYAIVEADGKLGTQSASGRWAFRTLYPANERARADQAFTAKSLHTARSRVACYKFDGWA